MINIKSFQLRTQNVLCYTWRQIWWYQVPRRYWNPLSCWLKRRLEYRVNNGHQLDGWSLRFRKPVCGLQRRYWRKGSIFKETPRFKAIIFPKNGWVERSLMREAKLRVKNKNFKYFDGKLRFAFLASLRSAIFSAKFKWTINWSLSPQGLK